MIYMVLNNIKLKTSMHYRYATKKQFYGDGHRPTSDPAGQAVEGTYLAYA